MELVDVITAVLWALLTFAAPPVDLQLLCEDMANFVELCIEYTFACVWAIRDRVRTIIAPVMASILFRINEDTLNFVELFISLAFTCLRRVYGRIRTIAGLLAASLFALEQASFLSLSSFARSFAFAARNDAATPDIHEWLGAFFSHPMDLLTSMRRGFILSGSRALSFFVPMACMPRSDFDFFCYPSARCVGEAIQALQRSGVVFEFWFKPICNILQSTNAIEILHYDDFKACHRHYFEHGMWAPPLVAEALAQIALFLEEDPLCHVIQLISGPVVRITRHRRANIYGNYSNDMHIITGITSHNGTCAKVQLVWAKNKAPADHLMDFYGSHVQAFISGYGAVCMYYYLAAIGISLHWLNNSQNQKSANAAILKYNERGFTTVVPTTSERTIRSPSDTGKVVLFDIANATRLDKLRADALLTLRWEEGGGETLLLRRETFEMRSQLKANRTYRRRIRSAGILEDYAVHVAMDYSTAFDTASHYVFPDEVTGF